MLPTLSEEPYQLQTTYTHVYIKYEYMYNCTLGTSSFEKIS
jgi:hypothetical protein